MHTIPLKKEIRSILKRDLVLTISLMLALVSSLFFKPRISYIDFSVLGMLLSFMLVVQLPYGVPVGQVADKNEKADEGQQQGIIRQLQQAAVGDGHHGYHRRSAYQGAHHVQYG